MYRLTIIKDLGPLPCGTKGVKENFSTVECDKCYKHYDIKTASVKHSVSGVCSTCVGSTVQQSHIKEGRFKEAINKSGIYILYKGLDIVYIGKSTTSVASRLNRHVRNTPKDFDSVDVYLITSLSNVNVVETYLIELHKPPLNSHSTYEGDCTLEIANLDSVIDTALHYNIDIKA